MIEILEAQVTDRERLVELYRECWRLSDGQRHPDFYAGIRDGFRRAWKHVFEQSDKYKAKVAWCDGEPVGFYTVGPLEENYLPVLTDIKLPNSCGELHQIYLLPEHQQRGCGRQLYNEAIESLRELGYGSFIICTYVDNEKANKFYKQRDTELIAKATLNIKHSHKTWERAVHFYIQFIVPKPELGFEPKHQHLRHGS